MVSAERKRQQALINYDQTTALDSLESKLRAIDIQEDLDTMDLSREITLEVVQMELRTHLRQSLTELTDIGWKMYQDDLKQFNDEGQLIFYFKLANELFMISELHEMEFSYRTDEPLLSDCNVLKERLFPRGPPKGSIDSFFESRQDDVKTLVQELQRNNYITKKAARKLTQLLNPLSAELERREVANITSAVSELFDSIYSTIETHTKPVPKKKTVIEEKVATGPTPEQIAESQDVLINFFDLREEIADNYANQLSQSDIIHMYSQLANTIGDEPAIAVIRDNPEILTYVQTNQWSKYVRALSVICNGTGQETIESYPTNEYSSLERALELKQKVNSFANSKDTAEITEELTKPEFELYRYTFLHTGNEHVNRRRESLIKKGKVTVTDRDHWNGGSSGARGNNIIMKLDYEIGILFSDLGLPEPDCNPNFGQRTLSISPQDQANLAEVAALYCK
ncbi:hypothetical protein HOE37_05090 [Candidatus Woesearchaeota archaeon]|jgi:hypothetical protein|nr:hypothetical protein [Candidatus Woesearchaeota archaeon]MBT4111207.1 hypothetical protein [Candidatus Woesearchaeota archaeon]MBT4336787.1 hypothetical protein [Candidatus Woesearchaeota archaeon]MBT4469455.1 hypothetical protein [Candidatus Woesearchaeota archaeon]MBT6744150.1 hypothetical protein [Candidatus Woesearchaeota archaeon]